MTTFEKIRAKIQKVIDTERDFTSENAKAQALALNWVLELFDKYAEQEPCDDAVSRQAVYEILEGNWNTDFFAQRWRSYLPSDRKSRRGSGSLYVSIGASVPSADFHINFPKIGSIALIAVRRWKVRDKECI